VLEGDRREDGIHDERTRGLPPVQQLAQDLPVTLARVEDAGPWLGEQGGDHGFSLGGGKRSLEDPWIRSNPQERPQGMPGKADELRSGQCRFEPCSALLVLLALV